MSQNQATQTQELIGTTEAAFLLNISAVRLRQLLQQGRVIGAYKQGRRWVIPLTKGMPKIKPGSRGTGILPVVPKALGAKGGAPLKPEFISTEGFSPLTEPTALTNPQFPSSLGPKLAAATK